jgi:nicotinamide-nucleotide amidase
MSAAIVSIGSELVRGEVADTNARWLASRLSDLGFDVVALLCLDDDEARIASALQRLGNEVDVVLVTGGLGPTPDDRTVAAAARAVGTTVVRDPETYAQLCRRLNAAGKETTAALARQTEVPKGRDGAGQPRRGRAGVYAPHRPRPSASSCQGRPRRWSRCLRPS